MTWLRFEILSPPPFVLAKGRVIDYRIRLHGCPVRWRTRIADYEPPVTFIDEQQSGPYAYWHHQHGFEAAGNRTLLTDRVRYALPLWLPEFVEQHLNSHFVAPALKDIFDYRASIIWRLFGTCSNPPGD